MTCARPSSPLPLRPAPSARPPRLPGRVRLWLRPWLRLRLRRLPQAELPLYALLALPLYQEAHLERLLLSLHLSHEARLLLIKSSSLKVAGGSALPAAFLLWRLRSRLSAARRRCYSRAIPEPRGVSTMAKIKVANPVVDMDGDEMTRIIWQADQGQADLPLSRHRARLLRPRHREPRRAPRTGSPSSGGGDQAPRRRRQMRDHHARRGAREGVRPQGDVEVAERHDPQHPRRRHLPRADHLPQRAAPRARAGRSPSSSAAMPSATSTARPTSGCPARAC